jgi:sugar-specific transcriptional regulator TrmB
MIAKFNYKLFGLEPRDIKVYESMLSMEEAASIRTIAEAVNLNRGTAFEIIKKLVRMGLVVSHFKNKRKYYSAQSPTSLKRYTNDVHDQIGQELLKIDTYTRELQNTKILERSGQFTQFYEGEEEIAALLRDVLDTVSHLEPKEYCVISSAEVRNRLYSKFRNFTKQRIKQKIFIRVIAIGEGGDTAALADRRWLTADRVPACYIIIYGNKVAQLSLSDLGEIQGVVVQNKGIAQLQQLMFERLWEYL